MKQDIQKWRSTQHRSRLKYANKLRRRVRRRRTVRISKITGEPIISRQRAERELWKAFSLYIRQRDKTCVLAQFGGCWGHLQAGHVIGRGKKATKYAEDNVFAQCQAHNNLHRYHPQLYYSWYIEKFGAKAFQWLFKRSQQKAKAISTTEAQQLTRYYQSKL